MYPAVFKERHAKHQHNAIFVYQAGGGGDFRLKGNTKVKLEATRKYSTTFKGKNTPL